MAAAGTTDAHAAGGYHERGYWDARYSESLQQPPGTDRGPLFDWLTDYEALRPRLAAARAALAQGAGCGASSSSSSSSSSRRRPRVLDLGCGNATLAEELAAEEIPEPASSSDGDACSASGRPYAYASVSAVDFSPAVIAAMRARAEQRGLGGRLSYAAMDARQLDFTDASFDLVLDKGCLDALLNRADQHEWWKRCGARGTCPPTHDWGAAAAAGADAAAMLAEAARVLAPGGIFLLVSYEPPAGRRAALESAGWHVAGVEEDDRGNYVYTCGRP